MPLFGQYYYGKHKWDNYLLDIQKTIKSGDAAHRQSIRYQKETLSELREQTAQLQHIQESLNDGFEQLGAQFEWGFTLLAGRMDRQIEELSQISAKLGAIHQTLLSPLMTQATELFRLGEERYKMGLLDKALEAYLQAEQKNDVDFVLQLQIGTLLLYGRDEFINVINLPEAERHLLLAARYAKAEQGGIPEWSKYCGQAYFHAAVAVYLMGEQEQIAGRPDAVRACLERAVGYLKTAATLWPAFTEILYTQAKCHALLGQRQEAQDQLQALSDRDRRYFEKATNDEDFSAFRAEVAELFKRAIASPGPLARAAQVKLDVATEALAWAKRARPDTKEDLAMMELIERGLAAARRLLPTLQVDIEELSDQLSSMLRKLETMAQKAFQKHVAAAEQELATAEARKSGSQASIAWLQEKMKATSGKVAGWVCGLLTAFFVGPLVASMVFATLTPQERQDPGIRGALGLVNVFGPIFVGLIAAAISRAVKNQPHRNDIQQHERAIAECIQALPSVRQRADAWKKEMQNFTAWQTRGSVS